MAKKSNKARWLGVLFALPFALVGTLIAGWAVTDVLTTVSMRSWVQVEATLSDAGINYHQGEDGTTNEAYANYSYEFKGQRYTGNRVAVSGGSDNIGPFQEQLGRRLERALNAGDRVTVYIDPDMPQRSIVDRSIRWGLTLFKTMFGLIFAAVGYGFLYAIFFYKTPQRSRHEISDTPWGANPAWQPTGILSNARLGARFALGFALFWNAISWTVFMVAIRDILDSGNFMGLLICLFPLTGLYLAWWAFRQRSDWRRFNTIPLVLDPFPSSIGGDVGGVFFLRTPFSPSAHFEVTVTSVRLSRDSDGDRNERLLWQDSMLALVRRGAEGTEIAFQIPIPGSQHESSPDEERGIQWRASLRGETGEGTIDRDYDIPVFATVESSTVLDGYEREQVERSSQDHAEQAVRQRAEFTFDHRGQRVFFPAGRHLGFGAGIAIGGIIFGVVGLALMLTGEARIIGGVFSLIAAFLLLSTLYLCGNSLQVTKRGGEIVSVRRLLGVPIRRRHIMTDRMKGLTTVSGMSHSSGRQHTVYFHVDLDDIEGNKIRIGEGFDGKDEAQAARKLLVETLGMPRRFAEAPLT